MDKVLPEQQVVGPYSPVFMNVKLCTIGSYGSPRLTVTLEQHAKWELDFLFSQSARDEAVRIAELIKKIMTAN